MPNFGAPATSAERASNVEQAAAPAEAPPATPRRRRGRRWALVGGVAVLAIGAGAGWYVTHQNETPTTPTTSQLPTVAVKRTDMTSTLDIDGTLGYGDSLTVLGGSAGRITWLPKVGDVLARGDRVYGVNGYKVPLFYGAAPLWRTLSQSVADGNDVRLLEQNLKALGFGKGLTVDRDYTYATAQAVKKWQKAQGRTRTGVVAPEDAVVQPGSIRVTKVQSVLGGSAGGGLFTASGTSKVVTVAVPVNEAEGVVREGAKVRVELPGDKKATGTIAAIGKVATSSSGTESQTGEGIENATVAVTIALDKSAAKVSLDGAPVTVGFSSSQRKNVLAVPVNALLAAGDNEYSVSVVDNGAVRSVPVKLGIFDGDLVEVTGELREGMKVQVPRS